MGRSEWQREEIEERNGGMMIDKRERKEEEILRGAK